MISVALSRDCLSRDRPVTSRDLSRDGAVKPVKLSRNSRNYAREVSHENRNLARESITSHARDVTVTASPWELKI